ncbi:hypothetical protein D3C86_1761470 [compost metagenome]
MAAWHLAPITRNCEALGPAPQLMYLFTSSVARGVFGRVLPTSFTAYSTTLSVTGMFLISFWKYWIWLALMILFSVTSVLLVVFFTMVSSSAKEG